MVIEVVLKNVASCIDKFEYWRIKIPRKNERKVAILIEDLCARSLDAREAFHTPLNNT